MQFKLDKVEDKPTSTGKPRKIVNIIGPEGELLERVTIWSGFPNFEALKFGDVVEGDYKDDGQYRTLYAPKLPQKAAGGFKSQVIEKAQETKRQDIEAAQDRKQEAIALAGAMRDSTLITLASLKDQPFPNDADFKREYEKWVKYLLNLGEQPFV